MLRAAIESLLNQSLAKPDYEIVVVDNASTDDTCAVVKGYQVQYSSPEIILVPELRQGLGYARNTGYKQARGRYVAFIDDDCVATKDWLQSLLNSYEHVEPTPWSVGGVVMPEYAEPKPEWFKDSYETDTWGDQPRFLKRGESFTGCNMSFRKDVIERFGGFDVELGMKGESLALAEETKLYRRIWSAEGEPPVLYYTPRAMVHHTIDPYKMTVSYQLKRAFIAGQVSYAMGQMESVFHRCVLFFGSIALMIWQSAMALLRMRPGRKWRNWAIEELYPVASHCGRLLAFLGVRLMFRQRRAVVPGAH
jgi:glucosyl-dolichyl phosphate glucuronosyltransferase